MIKITTRISPKAEVTVRVEGAEGAGCTELTREFEQKLGLTTSDSVTEEYYHVEQSNQDQNLA